MTSSGALWRWWWRATAILAMALACAAADESFLPDTAGFRGTSTHIPMRDGKALSADTYVPKTGGKFPVVLIQTPYDRKLLRRHWTGGINDGPNALFADTHYAFVITDWRGRFDSKDAATERPAKLGDDGFDTVTWITKQEWSNGSVGTWGPSALGRVQYFTAQAHPPGLKCAVPMVMPLNLNYDIYFPDGVMWEDLAAMLDRLNFTQNLHALLGAHPLKDAYWEALPGAHEIRAEEFDIPMLFIGSWYDIYTDSVVESFEQVRAKAKDTARRHSKLIMGPWVHAGDVAHQGDLDYPAADHYGLRQAHAFFDYWLREQKNGFDERSPVTYYQMGADEWRTTNRWPPSGTKERELFLRPDRSLGAKPPGAADALRFTFDPADPLPTVGGHVLTPELRSGPRDQREKVESRADAVVFTSGTLDKPLEVDGKVRAKLYVSSDRTDTDFAMILTDVYPDGRSMLIGEGARRMRLRNSVSKEELLKPGEIYPVTVEIPAVGLTFPAGHRVRLIVSSSDFPKFARNWNDGGVMYGEGPGVKAANSIFVNREHSSVLVLPVR